jgi:hypothetical protein
MMIGKTISHYRILEKLGEGGGVHLTKAGTMLGTAVAVPEEQIALAVSNSPVFSSAPKALGLSSLLKCFLISAG